MANDTSYSQTKEIHDKLDMLFELMTVEGNDLDTSFVRHEEASSSSS